MCAVRYIGVGRGPRPTIGAIQVLPLRKRARERLWRAHALQLAPYRWYSLRQPRIWHANDRRIGCDGSGTRYLAGLQPGIAGRVAVV